MRKLSFAFILLSAPAFAQEGPPEMMENVGGVSSYVAWTTETLDMLATADSARGGTLHEELLCSSCHGVNGIAQSSNWPNLAGQISGYTFKSLYDYHTWERTIGEGGPLMGYLVEELSVQDMADLSKYFSELPIPPKQDIDLTEEEIDIGETLHWLGDPERLIQPCSACHGNRGEGAFPNNPVIAGQTAGYLESQMLQYKSGERHSDIYSRMRLIAGALSDEEISAVSRYLATLSPNATDGE
jgi:cytochrome c553